MARIAGVVMAGRIHTGIVEDTRVAGPLRKCPAEKSDAEAVEGIPAEVLAEIIASEVEAAAGSGGVNAIGLALPGIIRGGMIEDSPNLPQLKGQGIERVFGAAFRARGINGPVAAMNDADAMAAGFAALHGELERAVRVWTLGNGIGFGRYPEADGVWEGGHTVVTLDPIERYCGCGGVGHLEGIMGHRAMRLRFLDREPEEVFAEAKAGDARCREFAQLWHRALAAAIATSIHLHGAGKFYITGPNARFVNAPVLNRLVQDMVKMSPLLGFVLEIVEKSDEIAVIGAAVNAAGKS